MSLLGVGRNYVYVPSPSCLRVSPFPLVSVFLLPSKFRSKTRNSLGPKPPLSNIAKKLQASNYRQVPDHWTGHLQWHKLTSIGSRQPKYHRKDASHGYPPVDRLPLCRLLSRSHRFLHTKCQNVPNRPRWYNHHCELVAVQHGGRRLVSPPRLRSRKSLLPGGADSLLRRRRQRHLRGKG